MIIGRFFQCFVFLYRWCFWVFSFFYFLFSRSLLSFIFIDSIILLFFSIMIICIERIGNEMFEYIYISSRLPQFLTIPESFFHPLFFPVRFWKFSPLLFFSFFFFYPVYFFRFILGLGVYVID